MFSQGRRDPLSVPSEVFSRARSFCSEARPAKAIRVLEQSCAGNLSDRDTVRILSYLGTTAIEERDYPLAYQAYQAAYERARGVPDFEPCDALSLLCDALEGSILASPTSKFLGANDARKDFQEAVLQVVMLPSSQVSPSLLARIIVCAGEVGSTQGILDAVEDYCNGSCAQHLNSAATEGLLELLSGHEYVRLERMQGMRLLHDAQEAYLNAYRGLQGFSEYVQLRPYALLCAARVAGIMQDKSGEELFLTESGNEFMSLPPGGSSPLFSARLLDAIAGHAALYPHFREFFQAVFERTELPLHHLVAGLSLWSRPYCTAARLRRAENSEQQNEITEDARRMLDRAEQLARDVTGISSVDRVLLSASKVHMALSEGDERQALAPLREGLRLAAQDPRCMDIIFHFLAAVAWEWNHAEYADELCPMFDELVQLSPCLNGYEGEVAEFKCQLVVGLANSLPYIDCPDERKAQIFTRALENLMSILKRRNVWSIHEIEVFAHILEYGVNLTARPLAHSENRSLLLALREVYAESLGGSECVVAANMHTDIQWLRHARRVEQNALVIFEALGDVHRHAASRERLDDITRQIEHRRGIAEDSDGMDEDDYLDDVPSF